MPALSTSQHNVSAPAAPGAPGADPTPGAPQRSLREQQVHRLRQEIGHPSGVRLTLRKRDCVNSLALVEFFGCVWVVGWKQREFPVLYNAFHVGDQILTVSGTPIRTVSEFSKAVKAKTEPPHVEIVIRRVPFAQVFHLRRDVSDAQPLGLVTSPSGEIKEVVAASPAASHGMTSKVRSFDGQTLVPWVLTAVTGRPVSLVAKDGEAGDRLAALGRDVSVLVQPADIVARMKKGLKAFRSYKEYTFG